MSLNHARPLLGCIADDFTGATDLANMLVRGGMRTVQSIGIPDAGMAADLDADAIVIALKSRTTPSADAVAESLAALEWLRERGCEQIFFKYCSTFDSTAAGNIGQVSEALLEQLGSNFTTWPARRSRRTAARFFGVTCSCRTSCSMNRACRTTR